MIVVLVYRPEAADSPDESDAQDRFDGIEVYGIYYDAESVAVTEMVDSWKETHPKWHVLISTGDKIKVGPNTFPMVAAPKTRKRK